MNQMDAAGKDQRGAVSVRQRQQARVNDWLAASGVDHEGMRAVFADQIARVLTHLLETWRDEDPDPYRVFRRFSLVPEKLIRFCGARDGDELIVCLQKDAPERPQADDAATEETGAPEEAEAVPISPGVVRLCSGRRFWKDDPPEDLVRAIAVCFAASVYPRRSYQMPGTRLVRRLVSFLAFVEAPAYQVETSPSIREALLQRLSALGRVPGNVEDAAVAAFLDDLSAASSVSADPRTGAQERAERLQGALLYLATCHEWLVKRIWTYWQREGALLRYFRRVATPPSELVEATGMDSRGSREPGEGPADCDAPPCVRASTDVEDAAGDEDQRRALVRSSREAPVAALEHVFQDVPKHLHENVIALEETVWHYTRRVIGAAPGLARQWVADFWLAHWAKFTCGFPYYGFEAKFATLWSQCVAHFDFTGKKRKRTRAARLDDVTTADLARDDAVDHGFSPDSLRCRREVFRLVRTTFYAGAAGDPVAGNEHVREIIDALYRERLVRKIDQEDDPELVKEIAARFGAACSTVNNYSHRLRMRLLVGHIARTNRWPNAAIRSARGSELGHGQRPKARPLANEKGGIWAVASLARSVPFEQTLLWAFTVHLFLRPANEGRWEDPWCSRRFVAELWRWVTEPHFLDVVQRAAEQGSRANRAALEALKRPPLAALYKDLMAIETEEALADYLRDNPLRCERQAAWELIQELTGLPRPDVYLGRVPLDEWGKIAKKYWIAPVWYLTIVERLDEAATVSQLVPSDDEIEDVKALHRAILASCPAPVVVRHSESERRS